MDLDKKIFNKAKELGEGMHGEFSLHDNTDEGEFKSYLLYHCIGVCAIISKSYDENDDEIIYNVTQPYDDFTIVSDKKIHQLLNM